VVSLARRLSILSGQSLSEGGSLERQIARRCDDDIVYSIAVRPFPRLFVTSC